jgi:hypothetical protein
MRMAPEQRARHARVIEMHVRQEDVRHVREADAEAIQAEIERGEARRRARIDERDTSGVTDNGGGDDVRTASELQVDPAKAGRKNGHALGEALY